MEGMLKKYLDEICDVLNFERESVRLAVNGDCISANWMFHEGTYRLYGFGNLIASFQLTQLPGCCAYVVSTGSYISVPYRKRGLGTILNNFRIDIAKHLGYTAIICTDLDNNVPQRKILEKNGWKDVHSLTNKRTDNFLHLTIKDLNEK